MNQVDTRALAHVNPDMLSNTWRTGKTLFLIAPPQRGLLEGFASGLISLANFVQLHEPAIYIRLLDYSQADPLEIDGELRSAVARAGDALIGITATTASYYNAALVAQACKRLRPETPVVLGGHHATAQDEVILRRHPEFDIVVRGEGEWALLSLLRSFPALSGVPGMPEHSCTAGIEVGRSQTEVDDARTECRKSSGTRFLRMPIQATLPGKNSKRTFAG
jgi:hypothetical protein